MKLVRRLKSLKPLLVKKDMKMHLES